MIGTIVNAAITATFALRFRAKRINKLANMERLPLAKNLGPGGG
jgi:hypothetical protein